MANPTALKRIPTRTIKDAWNFDALFVGGTNIMELIRQAGMGTGTGTGTGMSSINMFSELYQANAGGSGYVADDILRRMELLDATTTPSTSTVSWTNVSKATTLVTPPLPAHLSLFRDPGLTDAQLRATPLKVLFETGALLPGVGNPTDAVAPAAGTGDFSLVAGIKRMVAQLNILTGRTPDLGQQLSAASSPVVLSSQQEKFISDTSNNTLTSANKLTDLLTRFPATLGGTQAIPAMYVHLTNPGDITGGGSAATASKPCHIDDYMVVAAAANYAIGDQVRRISIFTLDPQPIAITTFWYNLTQNKAIAAPVMTHLQDKAKQDAIKYASIRYRVVSVTVGTDLAVADLETTLSGKVVSVHIYQVSGSGQVVGDDTATWDLAAGSTMSLQEKLGSALAVLSSDIKFRNTSGVLKLGVNYIKTGAAAPPAGSVMYLTDGVSYLTDSAGNKLVTP